MTQDTAAAASDTQTAHATRAMNEPPKNDSKTVEASGSKGFSVTWDNQNNQAALPFPFRVQNVYEMAGKATADASGNAASTSAYAYFTDGQDILLAQDPTYGYYYAVRGLELFHGASTANSHPDPVEDNAEPPRLPYKLIGPSPDGYSSAVGLQTYTVPAQGYGLLGPVYASADAVGASSTTTLNASVTLKVKLEEMQGGGGGY